MSAASTEFIFLNFNSLVVNIFSEYNLLTIPFSFAFFLVFVCFTFYWKLILCYGIFVDVDLSKIYEELGNAYWKLLTDKKLNDHYVKFYEVDKKTSFKKVFDRGKETKKRNIKICYNYNVVFHQERIRNIHNFIKHHSKGRVQPYEKKTIKIFSRGVITISSIILHKNEKVYKLLKQIIFNVHSKFKVKNDTVRIKFSFSIIKIQRLFKNYDILLRSVKFW